MKKEKILITSALPYANGPLHFGHIAGAYLPADAYARFQRLMKNDVLYICGSDEYGIAITMSAELAGRGYQEHVDLFHEINKKFFEKLNISFDHYSRTTWKGHVEPVQQYFLDLLNNGFIEARETEQLYSEKEQKFLADRYVVGSCPKCGFTAARGDECPSCGSSYEATDLINPRSKMSGLPLIKKRTKHWFLLLEKFKDKLEKWLETRDWKPNVINFIRGYVEDLHARAITRDSTWGVPVPLPGTEGKVLYVWFDAPIGYISATKEWAELKGDPEAWKNYWFDPETKLIQFIGKDNIPFHAVIFPAMTMGQNLPLKLVDELPANEFYNLEGRQFSKSDGWTIDLEDFFKRYTSDQIRFAIGSNAPETSDSEFTWKDFQLRSNSELLGKLGNFVNRVLVFAKNNCSGVAPSLDNLQAIDGEFLDKIRKLSEEAKQAYASFKLRRAAQLLMELAQAGNVYFDAKKPWSDAKDLERRTFMETTIACCLECLKAIAVVSSPLIPETAKKIWSLLGFSQPIENYGYDQVLIMSIPLRQKLGEPLILFKRIEDEEIAAQEQSLKERLKKNMNEPIESLKPEISYEDFQKVDLRAAKIIQAERVPKSKKLLRLEVAIAEEKRQIIAGIGESYTPEELIGKTVVVVANLKSAKLMGLESQGMVLAVKGDSRLTLLDLDQIESGTVVK